MVNSLNIINIKAIIILENYYKNNIDILFNAYKNNIYLSIKKYY